jgi:thioredoxin-related protein
VARFKKLSITLILLLASLLFSSHLFAIDYNEALKSAKKENRPVLVYFFSRTCRYCNMMDRDTLGDKEIDDILKKNFVYTRVEVEKSQDIARLYGVNGFPTSWFLEASGKRIFEAPGFIQKVLFKKVLEYVKGGYYKQMELGDYVNRMR